jgi:hypothetical protein
LDQPETPPGQWLPTSRGANGCSAETGWLGINSRFSPYVEIYRLPSLDFVTRLTNDARIRRLTFSPNGDELATASSDHLTLWSTRSWTMRAQLTNFMSVIYAPREGGWWLSSDSRSAGLYKSKTEQPLLPLPRGVLPLATSGGGRYLAVSVDARRLQVWDLAQVRKQFRELGIDWESPAANAPTGR